MALALMAAVSSILLVGCKGDGNGTGPDVITLADLAGTWTATQYTVTSKANPAMSVDFVAIGGAFTWTADANGDFTGEVVIPAALGGPMTLQFEGSYALIGQDSLQVDFDPEIPPLLTSGPIGFDLNGNTATITDSDDEFDFDDDGTPEPATFEGILVRS